MDYPGVGRGLSRTVPAWKQAMGSSVDGPAPGGGSTSGGNTHTSGVLNSSSVLSSEQQKEAQGSALQVIGEWSSHRAPSGTIYYYNSIEKRSTWEKPQCFASVPGEGSVSGSKSQWRAVKTDDGRTFYNNASTGESRWERPVGFDEGSNTTIVKSAEVSKPPDSSSDARADDAAKHDFLLVLKERNVPANMSWETAVRVLSDDARFFGVPSLMERRNLFEEYVKGLARAGLDISDESIKDMKDLVRAALDRGSLTLRSRFMMACDVFRSDRRWNAIPESIRMQLFEDVICEIAIKEAEARPQKREEALRAFRKWLRDSPWFSVRTTWQFLQREVSRHRGHLISSLDNLDLLTVFDELLSEKVRREGEDLSQDRVSGVRVRRKNREALVAFFWKEVGVAEEAVRKWQVDGTHDSIAVDDLPGMTVHTNWKTFESRIDREQCYRAVARQPGSTPEELFGDVIGSLRDRLSVDRGVIRAYLKEIGFSLTIETTMKEFFDVLSKRDASSGQLSVVNSVMVYQSLMDTERERKIALERLKRRNEDAFIHFLRSSKIDVEAKYEDILDTISSSSEFLAVEGEERRKKLFKNFKKEEQDRRHRRRHGDDRHYHRHSSHSSERHRRSERSLHERRNDYSHRSSSERRSRSDRDERRRSRPEGKTDREEGEVSDSDGSSHERKRHRGEEASSNKRHRHSSEK